MRLDCAYRLNTPAVASQTLEGETILIHFDSGHYFSSNAAGTRIIEALSAGATPAQLLESSAHPEKFSAFMGALLGERLIVASDAVPGTSAPMSLPAEIPELEKFTDLQDMLLLDPIHEVDAAGWPIKPAEPLTK